jgi:hypothetical protein
MQRHTSRGLVVVLTAALLSIGTQTSAATLTLAVQSQNCGGFDFSVGDAGQLQSLTENFNCLFDGRSQAIALGGPGLLGAVVNVNNEFDNSISAAEAAARIDSSFILHRATNDLVSMSLNLFVAGNLLHPIGAGVTSYEILIDAGVFGSGVVFVENDAVFRRSGSINVPLPSGGGVILTTPIVALAPNVTIPFRLGIEVDGFSGLAGHMSVDYSHTLSFSPAGPVFNLPDDVTIDVEGVNVTNNHWTDPRTSDVAPVPEPATLTLLGTGLAIAGRRATRKHS